MLDRHTNVLLFSFCEYGVSQLLAQKVKSVTTLLKFDKSDSSKKHPFYPIHLDYKIHYLQYDSNDKLANENRIFNNSRQYDMIFNFDYGEYFNVEQFSQLNEVKQIGYEMKKENNKWMQYVYLKDESTRSDCLKPEIFEELGLLPLVW